MVHVSHMQNKRRDVRISILSLQSAGFNLNICTVLLDLSLVPYLKTSFFDHL